MTAAPAAGAVPALMAEISAAVSAREYTWTSLIPPFHGLPRAPSARPVPMSSGPRAVNGAVLVTVLSRVPLTYSRIAPVGASKTAVRFVQVFAAGVLVEVAATVDAPTASALRIAKRHRFASLS